MAKPKRQGELTVSVDAYLAELEHPLKDVITALRRVILGVDKRVGETIKWNAPSFHTTKDFATFHLRSKTGVMIVLHHGAKATREVKAFVIDDPAGLLTWRGKDRALITFTSATDVAARKAALVRILRQWINQL